MKSCNLVVLKYEFFQFAATVLFSANPRGPTFNHTRGMFPQLLESMWPASQSAIRKGGEEEGEDGKKRERQSKPKQRQTQRQQRQRGKQKRQQKQGQKQGEGGKKQEQGSRKQEAGSGKREAGSEKREAKSKRDVGGGRGKRGAGSRKREAATGERGEGSRRREAGSGKLGKPHTTHRGGLEQRRWNKCNKKMCVSNKGLLCATFPVLRRPLAKWMQQQCRKQSDVSARLRIWLVLPNGSRTEQQMETVRQIDQQKQNLLHAGA